MWSWDSTSWKTTDLLHDPQAVLDSAEHRQSDGAAMHHMQPFPSASLRLTRCLKDPLWDILSAVERGQRSGWATAQCLRSRQVFSLSRTTPLRWTLADSGGLNSWSLWVEGFFTPVALPPCSLKQMFEFYCSGSLATLQSQFGPTFYTYYVQLTACQKLKRR